MWKNNGLLKTIGLFCTNRLAVFKLSPTDPGVAIRYFTSRVQNVVGSQGHNNSGYSRKIKHE